MIYLDNAATTKPLEQLKELYGVYAGERWQNPSALYAPATQVQKSIKEAADALLREFGSAQHKCLFTSGGTESANMVILRGARKRKDMNFVCGGAEHPCVEESYLALREQGYTVRFVQPDMHGNVQAGAVAEAVDGNTALVSVMHVNNETGAKNDVAQIAAAVKVKNTDTLFHADGVQAYLREEIDSRNIDYYTVSAHKVHALKGTGAVFYRSDSPLKPYILGGGQQSGLRSGTENTFGILAFAEAGRYYGKNKAEFCGRLGMLRKRFLDACAGIEDAVVISPEQEEKACSHIVNVSFPGAPGETLLHALEAERIYISMGAACSSKKGKTRIAKALGLSDKVAGGSVRISFSPFNTEEEVDAAVESIKKNVAMLRKYMRK